MSWKDLHTKKGLVENTHITHYYEGTLPVKQHEPGAKPVRQGQSGSEKSLPHVRHKESL